MSKPNRGLRHIGSNRLNAMRDCPAFIARRIQLSLQDQRGRNRYMVAVLANGDITWGPCGKGLIAKVLSEPNPGDFVVGIYNRAATAATIEAALKEHMQS